MTIDFRIDRITIAAHGVSALIAESAVNGLAEELRRRLGAFPASAMAALDLAELRLDPFVSGARLDAEALREMIAERLVAAMLPGGRTDAHAQEPH